MMGFLSSLHIIIAPTIIVQWRKWGGSHTENAISGLPAHLKWDKITKKTLKELVKDKLSILDIKRGETHYSLNPKRTD
jgi:hypothetical protein